MHEGILICDALFVTAAMSTSVIDVFAGIDRVGIEMADAGPIESKQQIYVDFLARLRLQKDFCKT